ncbi:MAG: DUF4199 domain-containing protein [Bacteroidales bacterium]|nr:DUF4199 domain-containing protein [Bacteroidales bacterium]
MEENEKLFTLKQLMLYGAIIGVLLILNALMLSRMGINILLNTEEKFITNLQPLIIGLGIYFSLKHYSYKIINERLKFGKFLGFGIIIGAFSSIIYSFYLVMFVTYISPDTLVIFKEMMIEQQTVFNFPEEALEQAVQMMTHPIFLFITFVLSTTFWSGVFSLMFAIFNLIIPKPKNKI